MNTNNTSAIILTGSDSGANQKPSLSIVIATFNRRKDLVDVIEAVKRSTYKNVEIIVVDDCSTDGTAQGIRRLFPEVRILQNEKNEGAAVSRNIGMKNAADSAEYILLLDSDVIVEIDAIEELVSGIEGKKEYGATMGKVYFDQNRKLIQFAGSYVDLYTGINHCEGGLDDGRFDEQKEIKGAGAVFMIKKEIISKVGLFDPVYRIYYEDADYSLRIIQAGYKILFVPTAKFYHRYPLLSKEAADRRFLKNIYLSSRNKIIFMRKHSKCFPLFILTYPIYPIFYIFKALKYSQYSTLGDVFAGIRDGLKFSLNYQKSEERFFSDFLLKIFRNHIYLNNKFIRQEAAKIDQVGVRLLDVGAGGVPFRRYFKHLEYRTQDVTQNKSNTIDYVCDINDGLKEMYDGSFNYIISTQTLEHIKKPEVFFNECYRVLKPGGKLFLTTNLCYEEHSVPDDYYRFTRYGLRYLGEAHKFSVEMISPQGGIFQVLFYIVSYLPVFIFIRRYSVSYYLYFIFFSPLIFGFGLVCYGLDFLDKEKRLTLNYQCIYKKTA